MRVTHLDRDGLYEAMAKECRVDHEGSECWHQEIGIGCPFDWDEDEYTLCAGIQSEHWREVFEGKEDQKPEPLPEFQFGDKVTAMLPSPCEAIFNAYVKYHGFIRAAVLFEGSECCEEVAVADLKAGWDG